MIHDLVEHDRRHVGHAVGRAGVGRRGAERGRLEQREVGLARRLRVQALGNAGRRVVDVDVLAVAARQARVVGSQVQVAAERRAGQTPRASPGRPSRRRNSVDRSGQDTRRPRSSCWRQSGISSDSRCCR